MALPRAFAFAFALIALLIALSLATHGTSASTQSELGDVDCSGAVDSLDALVLLQRVSGLIDGVPCEKSDDTDENGTTDATDAAFVLQYVADLIPILPAPSVALANIPTQCPKQAELTDGAIMATDILTRSTHELFLPRGQRITMGQELDAVLERIRGLEPIVAGIEPLPTYPLGTVIVTLGPALYERIYDLLQGSPDTVAFVLGSQGFDALNVRLRLVGFEPLLAVFGGTFAPFRLCFPYHLNVPVSAATFDALPEVLNAGGQVDAGDGPDIEALKDGGTWYVVARDGSGDCPSGCSEETFHYFTDNGEGTVQVDEAQALEDPRFAAPRCYVSGGPDCTVSIQP